MIRDLEDKKILLFLSSMKCYFHEVFYYRSDLLNEQKQKSFTMCLNGLVFFFMLK